MGGRRRRDDGEQKKSLKRSLKRNGEVREEGRLVTE